MEKEQGEVTQKIRSAIKKKLAEICDFLDDELPEYIMILVANQRSKSQVEKDLSLFLRNDTVNFTSWLFELLKSFNSGASDNQLPISKSEPVIEKNIQEDEDAVVLGFDPDEHETDFLSQEDTNDSVLSKSFFPSSSQAKEIKEPSNTKLTKCNIMEKDRGQASTGKTVKGNTKSIVKVEPEHTLKTKSSVKNIKVFLKKSISTQNSKGSLSSAVIPVNKKIAKSQNEYDPTEPEYKKALKSPNSRKYGGLAALQANKLLLKAVDDATKSILVGKSLEDFYKPTPIKVLTSKQLSIPSVSKSDFQKGVSTDEILPEVIETHDEPEASEFEAYEYSDDQMEEVNMDFQISENKAQSICINPVSSISDSSDQENMEYIQKNVYSYPFTAIEEIRPKSPHFIVTLDGVNRTSLKRKFDDSVDSMEEEFSDVEDEHTIDKTVSSDKKIKLSERCKYWPACKNSDHCSYHHPTVTCKCFPDCKFGDKCLYIHPNCKFDARCSRKDCPYTHASKRKLPFITVPVKVMQAKGHRKSIVCKFYPKCTSKNCPFIHPKLCRYGTECRLPACVFGHYPVPPRSQMKWQAT